MISDPPSTRSLRQNMVKLALNILAASGLACAAIAADRAAISRIGVAPILVDVETGQNSALFYLNNDGERSVPVRLRIMQWVQDGGIDRLKPDNGVVISPAVVTIAPGETQHVRILRRDGSTGTKERAYRLIVDEIGRAGDSGLAMRLRMTVPVFFAGAGGTAHETGTISARFEEGRIRLTNNGRKRLRLHDLKVEQSDGSAVPLSDRTLTYVLAGSTVSWPSPVPCEAAIAVVGAHEEGRFHVPVQSDCR